MKVLIFNWRDIKHPWAGGAELMTHEIAKRLVATGNELTLFCGGYPDGSCKDEIDGVRIIRVGEKYSVYVHAALHYLKYLKKQNFDIVIDEINGVPWFTPFYVRKPKIAIIHHLVKEIFFTELPKFYATLGYLAESMMPIIYRNVPILTVSPSARKEVIDFGFPRQNIYLIKEGIDHDIYVPSNPKSAYPHILYLGRIRRYKNIHLIIQAMKYIIKEIPEARLSIAGKGNDYELKKLSTRAGLNDYVRFHGFVSEEEKVRLLQKAHIKVSPSCKEGWGLTTIEANAAGTPVIASKTHGLMDSVIDGKTGILVPNPNPKNLAVEIVYLLKNHKVRRTMRKNAIRWAKQFCWNRTADEFFKICQHTISSIG